MIRPRQAGTVAHISKFALRQDDKMMTTINKLL